MDFFDSNPTIHKQEGVADATIPWKESVKEEDRGQIEGHHENDQFLSTLTGALEIAKNPSTSSSPFDSATTDQQQKQSQHQLSATAYTQEKRMSGDQGKEVAITTGGNVTHEFQEDIIQLESTRNSQVEEAVQLESAQVEGVNQLDHVEDEEEELRQESVNLFPPPRISIAQNSPLTTSPFAGTSSLTPDSTTVTNLAYSPSSNDVISPSSLSSSISPTNIINLVGSPDMSTSPSSLSIPTSSPIGDAPTTNMHILIHTRMGWIAWKESEAALFSIFERAFNAIRCELRFADNMSDIGLEIEIPDTEVKKFQKKYNSKEIVTEINKIHGLDPCIALQDAKLATLKMTKGSGHSTIDKECKKRKEW